jgi:hypothetical protein
MPSGRFFRRRPDRAESFARAVESAKGLDPAAQVEVVRAAAIAQPDQPTANDLWRYLVLGLLGVLVISVLGLVVLLAIPKDNAALLTVFSSSLSGLLGLFAPSPAGNGAGKAKP